MKAIATLAGAALLAGPASAQVNPEPSPGSSLPGVWSIGETRNCADGPAWVFFADGFYGEMKLPSEGINAVGVWRDTPKALLYTHMHLPFAGLDKPVAMKPLTIVERTRDRIVMTNVRGQKRVFHRCPSDAMKAPEGQAGH